MSVDDCKTEGEWIEENARESLDGLGVGSNGTSKVSLLHKSKQHKRSNEDVSRSMRSRLRCEAEHEP